MSRMDELEDRVDLLEEERESLWDFVTAIVLSLKAIEQSIPDTAVLSVGKNPGDKAEAEFVKGDVADARQVARRSIEQLLEILAQIEEDDDEEGGEEDEEDEEDEDEE